MTPKNIEDKSSADEEETVMKGVTENVTGLTETETMPVEMPESPPKLVHNPNIISTETETMPVEKSESPPKLLRKPNIISTEDVAETIKTAKLIKPVKYKQISKVSFYDFAGQDIFHASHPTFLSPKSIYTLVFDLKEMYSHQEKKRKQESGHVKFFGDCRGGETLGNTGKWKYFGNLY